MASSRHMRRSRMPSPAKSFTQDVPVKSEAHVDYVNGNMAEGWTEPPLRTPAPSFEDYKGLERHGVLEHMAPLGSLPGHKVKARLKQHEPPRRIPHLKNGDAGGAREDVKTPESTQPIVTRRSEPRKSEEKLAKVSSSKEGDLDEDYNPRVNTRITPIKATSTHTAAAGTAISRIPSGQLRLQQIVESAISRSRELGDPALGLALRRLYEESLRNTVLNDLLEAILSQRPSSHQTAEFQSYIKAARRQMKEGDDSAKRSKRSASKSPAARTRAHVTRHCRTAKDRTTNALGVNYNLPNCSPQISRQHADMTAANGSPSKDEHPSKRIKRSRSVSSDSSLSSLDSTIEDFVPAIEAALPTAVRSVSASKSNQSKLQPSLGPRLGSFSTRPSDPSNRRPIIAANYPTAEELAAKKREKLDKLKQGFQDYVVRDSGIRASPSPMKYHQSIPPTGVLAERTQSRLRNSVGQKGRRDEHEALDSPASSACGEMLVPPPPGASRGVTPNQLGRPPKAVKKAARIKISPLKKRNGVTAGIGRTSEVENNGVGYGRTDDNQEFGNADVCTSCSGNGQLLCCDGCPRVFHFTCCDPPIDAAKPPEGEWFCIKCLEHRTVVPKPPRGIFGELVGDLNQRNPVAFNLPHPIRDFFEGVKTGEEGEYEEASTVKANKARPGYEEAANNFKLKDSKDNAVLCFRCGKSAMEHREIVACDYCNLSWHLDCVDPPLAATPVRRSNNGRPRSTWMCPNHVETELSTIDVSALKSSNQVKSGSGRSYKVRRPKKVTIVDTALRRGFKNNGLIEIEDELSEEETKIADHDERGRVIYRVPAKGLKLDFIDRVKRSNLETAKSKQSKDFVQHQPMEDARVPGTTEANKAQQTTLDKRPFSERKAALNLAQMAKFDAILSPDKVKNLIEILVAEAPTEVEKLYAAGDVVVAATVVSEQERKDLEALIDLALRRLEEGKSA